MTSTTLRSRAETGIAASDAPADAQTPVLPPSLGPGHRACLGCGQALACRLLLDAAREAAGGRIVVANATGCLQVFSTAYPYSSWNVPWIHSLFENAAAVAAGIEAALRAQGRTGPGTEDIRVIAQGGDGGTADIGLQALSGLFERGHDVLYLCYDNEAYMNTGVQRSGLTPPGARTVTTPVARQGQASSSHQGQCEGARSRELGAGAATDSAQRETQPPVPGPQFLGFGNPRPKKDLPGIALAHGVSYVATASIGYYGDLEKKVRKAMTFRGPRYLQVHVPCPLGWGHEPHLTIKIAQLAARTGLYPLVEYEHGRLVTARQFAKRPPVAEYLRLQTRFAHLFRSEDGAAQVAQLQAIADANVARYQSAPPGVSKRGAE